MVAPFSPAFEAYVAPARARSSLVRLLIGAVVALIIFAAWAIGIVAVFGWLAGAVSGVGWLRQVNLSGTPLHTYVMLATFFGMALGPMLVVRYLHMRPVATLFGRAPVVLHDFVLAAVVVGGVYAIVLALWGLRFDAVPQLSPSLWLLLLPLSLIGVAVQTGAEELLFRGYLQQQLAARFRSPLIWMLVPSLLFGAAHYDPVTAGGNLWVVVGAAAIFGLAAADLTARTGSIGAAWGFHFANNTSALLVLAVQGTIPGLALFVTPYSADDPLLSQLILIDIAALALSWLLIRRILLR